MIQGDRTHVNLYSLMSVALLAAGFCCLSGCANRKPPQVDYRPMQIRWTAAPGLNEESLPNKDLCVIRITSQLLTEEAVLSSTAGELSYDVIFEQSLENSENLIFTGVCEDLTLVGLPECRWFATCDSQGNVVVKFNNGD